MTGPKGTCKNCGLPVEHHERAAYPVRGFDVERDGGGLNHVVEKQRIDGWVWHARHGSDCFQQMLDRRNGAASAERLL